MAGVEGHAEERIGEAPADDVVKHASGDANADGAVPLRDPLEVRRDESLHVVAHPRR